MLGTPGSDVGADVLTDEVRRDWSEISSKLEVGRDWSEIVSKLKIGRDWSEIGSRQSED